MKNQLIIMFYSFMAMSLCLNARVNAQIVYYDVNPDYTITCSGSLSCLASDSFDLNNDSNMDFELSASYGYIGMCSMFIPPKSSGTARVTSFGLNSFFAIDSTNPSAFHLGDTIDNNLVWMNGTGILRNINRPTCTGLINSGNWVPDSVYYLPIKINKLGNNYFGWIRMKTHMTGVTNVQIIVMSYAYNSVPNQLIVAGDTVSGPTSIIKNIGSDAIILFPNPVNSSLTIGISGHDKEVKVTIVDVSGKVFFESKEIALQKLVVNTKDFAKGIYFVRIQDAEFIESKKLIVE